MSERKSRGYITPDPGHLNCSPCGSYNVLGCTHCHRCTNCCNCSRCGRCGQPHQPPTICEKCLLHIGQPCKVNIGGTGKVDVSHQAPVRTCQCGGRSHAVDVLRLLKRDKVDRSYRSSLRGANVGTCVPGFRDRPSPTIQRAVTVEIELTNYRDAQEPENGWAVGWNMERDGSIVGPRPGELIYGPIISPLWAQAFEDLSSWLKRSKAVGNTHENDTAGLHIHVDAKDLGPYEMRRLVRLYQVMEPTFYTCCHPTRVEKRHSRALTRKEWEGWLSCTRQALPRKIHEALLVGNYTGTPAEHGIQRRHRLTAEQLATIPPAQQAVIQCLDRANGKYDSSRYRGLNLHSWFYRGTVEFRHHEGTADGARIDLWAQWCRWFVELAARMRDAEVAQVRTADDLLLGAWKRPYGMLALPREVVEMVQGGRVPFVAPAPRPEGDEFRPLVARPADPPRFRPVANIRPVANRRGPGPIQAQLDPEELARARERFRQAAPPNNLREAANALAQQGVGAGLWGQALDNEANHYQHQGLRLNGNLQPPAPPNPPAFRVNGADVEEEF